MDVHIFTSQGLKLVLSLFSDVSSYKENIIIFMSCGMCIHSLDVSGLAYLLTDIDHLRMARHQSKHNPYQHRRVGYVRVTNKS